MTLHAAVPAFRHVVPIDLGQRSYDVVVEAGAMQRLAQLLAPFAARGRLLFVTDANVASAYQPVISAGCDAMGLAHHWLVLTPGESSKSWDGLAQTCDWLLGHEVERKEAIIALGGGVIGDLTGFAASMLKRGCDFVQVPTTLLAQVDSSVGGKTAINTSQGKNLVGAFYQPRAVFADPAVLDSLPPRELAAGYAEVVKYGLIDNPGFFDWCEANGPALLAGDPALRGHAIATSVAAKAAIVAADERELSGTRALLNLGHTFGHALEAETGFSDRLLHGEGVALGMILAARYSARLGQMDDHDVARIVSVLGAAGLPTSLAAAGIDASGATLTAHMLHDKKVSDGKLPFILMRGIGAAYLDKAVDLADVAAFLDGELG